MTYIGLPNVIKIRGRTGVFHLGYDVLGPWTVCTTLVVTPATSTASAHTRVVVGVHPPSNRSPSSWTVVGAPAAVQRILSRMGSGTGGEFGGDI